MTAGSNDATAYDPGAGKLAPAGEPRSISRRDWTIVAAIMLVAAFLIRGWQFGDPLIHVDEDFYLLVGDRMLHGALPYVDVWDRKQVGLFLLYAAIRLLGGGGIVQYQVVATLFVAATAFVAARIAVRTTTLFGAIAAGILYMLMLGLAEGNGGQAPVFYNLPVAVAALATLKALTDRAGDAREIRRLGCGAMLLCGLAMQIKFTVVFEGVFFGLALLRASWLANRDPRRMVADAALWIALAVAPTLAAIGVYAAIGHLGDFVYANFASILARSPSEPDLLVRRLGNTYAALHLPLFCVVVAAALGTWRRVPGGTAAFGFVMAWLGAAFAGWALFGTYFNHYALPLMTPIAIGAAPLLGYRRRYIGIVVSVLLLVAGAVGYHVQAAKNYRGHGGTAKFERQVALIRQNLRGGCLYVYDGEPMLYYLTPPCIRTRFLFPSHLNLLREAGAIGVDPVAEVRRILAQRPTVLVVTLADNPKAKNPVTAALVAGEIRSHYRLVGRFRRNKSTTAVFARNLP